MSKAKVHKKPGVKGKRQNQKAKKAGRLCVFEKGPVPDE